MIFSSSLCSLWGKSIESVLLNVLTHTHTHTQEAVTVTGGRGSLGFHVTGNSTHRWRGDEYPAGRLSEWWTCTIPPVWARAAPTFIFGMINRWRLMLCVLFFQTVKCFNTITAAGYSDDAGISWHCEKVAAPPLLFQVTCRTAAVSHCPSFSWTSRCSNRWVCKPITAGQTITHTAIWILIQRA